MKSTTRPTNRTTRPSRKRSLAAVAAFVVLGLVQLFVSAVVPLAEGRAPSKLGAHVEQPTERRHYVHDEAYCASCIARHLTGTAPLPAPIPLVATTIVAQPPTAPFLPPDAERRDPSAARAPPAPARLG
jgi:hypothetical protein